MALSNYPPGVTGMEREIAGGNEQDGEQDLDCDCGHTQTVGTSEDYSHGVVYWWADWTCDNCKDTHSSEGEYEPSEDVEDYE
jgi:hypothetical protein